MQFVPSLLDNLAYINSIPPAVWLVWLGVGGMLGLALSNWRAYQPKLDARGWAILGSLVVATLVTALLFGLEFSSSSSLPSPGLPEKPPGSTMMIFSAIPWMLAGGWLGPFVGAGMGMLSGLVRAVWDTHSLFTVIELGLTGALFAVANRQRYRTQFYGWLRQPLFSAILLTVVHAILFVLSAF